MTDGVWGARSNLQPLLQRSALLQAHRPFSDYHWYRVRAIQTKRLSSATQPPKTNKQGKQGFQQETQESQTKVSASYYDSALARD